MTDFKAPAPREVNTTTAGDQLRPAVATLANGGHVVAWTSMTSATDPNPVVMAQAYDASGARTGGELTLVRGYALGGIAALADGSLVVSLTQSSTDPSGPRSAVSFARFDTAGNVLAAPVLVDGSGNYDVWLSAGDVFARADGGFALVETHTSRPVPWSTTTHTVHLFDAANAGVGQFAAGENWAQGDVVQEMKGGGFVTVNQPFTGPGPSIVGWNVFDANGNSTASGTLHSTYGSTTYSGTSAVALDDGRALVVWQFTDHSGTPRSTLQGQWIDAGGHAAGGVFDWAFPAMQIPQLTGLVGGGFLATWTQQASASAAFELVGQYFDGSAQPASEIMHLATLGSSPSASAYEVVATSDGGFLVDYQQAGNGQDIHEREFDVVTGGPAGTPGGHIDVNGGITAIPAGSYTITGTAGIDGIAFAGAHTQYSVTPASISGPEGTDTLTSIERVHFGDNTAIAFDVNGDAGMAYRLYQAAFDRAPDLPGLGFHIHNLDGGVPLTMVAEHFIASPEFQSTYGNVDNAGFIDLLYQNVLNRAPDPGGLQFHLDEFAQGESRADMLTHFSESPENQANVIGLIGNGMLYVPLA